jgi:hypothetical protein
VAPQSRTRCCAAPVSAPPRRVCCTLRFGEWPRRALMWALRCAARRPVATRRRRCGGRAIVRVIPSLARLVAACADTRARARSAPVRLERIQVGAAAAAAAGRTDMLRVPRRAAQTAAASREHSSAVVSYRDTRLLRARPAPPRFASARVAYASPLPPPCAGQDARRANRRGSTSRGRRPRGSLRRR